MKSQVKLLVTRMSLIRFTTSHYQALSSYGRAKLQLSGTFLSPVSLSFSRDKLINKCQNFRRREKNVQGDNTTVHFDLSNCVREVFFSPSPVPGPCYYTFLQNSEVKKSRCVHKVHTHRVKCYTDTT